MAAAAVAGLSDVAAFGRQFGRAPTTAAAVAKIEKITNFDSSPIALATKIAPGPGRPRNPMPLIKPKKILGSSRSPDLPRKLFSLIEMAVWANLATGRDPSDPSPGRRRGEERRDRTKV